MIQSEIQVEEIKSNPEDLIKYQDETLNHEIRE